MIKLSLPNPPAELTEDLQQILINEFNEDRNDPVWKKDFIRKAVFAITNGKCAYSEVMLLEEGKDMQIDHFYPKSIYPCKIVEWGNLLPSLNHCNRNKKDVDPNTCELVNPLNDDPKDSFYFIGARMYYKDKKGMNTRDKLKLNDEYVLYQPRHVYLKGIKDNLRDIGPWIEKDISYFVIRLNEIMQKGTPCRAYSAAVATFILSNEIYLRYRDCMKDMGLWDAEFRALEEKLEFCSLPQ